MTLALLIRGVATRTQPLLAARVRFEDSSPKIRICRFTAHWRTRKFIKSSRTTSAAPGTRPPVGGSKTSRMVHNEMVNFEETVQEDEESRPSQDRAGEAENGYLQESEQSGVNGSEGSTRQEEEYEGRLNGHQTTKQSLRPESSSAHLTVHTQALTERSAHPPSSITSRGVEGGTLTTTLNSNSHDYSPMNDGNINLQAITAAAREYAVADTDSGGYGHYKDSSNAPTRRQNVACDACRARKVKCVRKPGAEQVSAGIEFTRS